MEHVAPRRMEHDEEGSYIVYVDRTCTHPGCGVQLTSRNRFRRKLLCIAHRNSGRYQAPRKQSAEESRGPTFGVDPARVRVHRCLSNWMDGPTDKHANEQLRAAMVHFELVYRFTFHELPPPRTPQEIPVEDLTPTNPAHRMTRPEFLVTADEMGV